VTTAPVSPLVTDLYQFTMLDAYRRLGHGATATFELFTRRLPEERGFLLVAGLEQALEYLETLSFGDEDLAWLEATGRFGPGFADWLRSFRFTGDVWAVPEGTVLFADEPWLRVVAPLPEAQLIESRLINLLHFQTLIASKAARCVLAADGRGLVDFGMRRAHGAEAAVLAARACVAAGFAGTATVEAGRRFGVPLYGTMAHSFVQAHDDERTAFANYARCHPGRVVLLLDTYDTLAAAHEVVALVRGGTPVQGVRIDSGDLDALSRAVRAVLDAGGCGTVRILASGNLDEHSIAALVRAGAPIDTFGVGTRLDASVDAPTLDAVYKLEEYDGRARRKRSTAKATWPGRKQVWRVSGADGRIVGDTVALEGERAPGEPLLVKVMAGGRRLAAPEPLPAIAARARASLAALPDAARSLDRPRPLEPAISGGLRALAAEVDRATGAPAGPSG
jgi:nicotinate phosphoribosyltransferase